MYFHCRSPSLNVGLCIAGRCVMHMHVHVGDPVNGSCPPMGLTTWHAYEASWVHREPGARVPAPICGMDPYAAIYSS